MAEKSKTTTSPISPTTPSPSLTLSPPLVTYSPTNSRSPSKNSSNLNSSDGIVAPANANIETQVLESTPILEAFGNFI